SYCLPVLSPRDGFIHSIDSRKIGYSLIKIKAGRMKVSDAIDYTAGATLPLKIGEYVKKGDVIGLVHCNSEERGREVVSDIREAYKIADIEAAKQELIHKVSRSD
ncbi:MAG: thymidine phosphorylase, partial [Candidatus Cloacimonadaceae bacterium]|nr:thymidine phosphorylase [Candidatus Cloacimonadaceae bacterium]